MPWVRSGDNISSRLVIVELGCWSVVSTGAFSKVGLGGVVGGPASVGDGIFCSAAKSAEDDIRISFRGM
jgi:hypothetical protein